MTGDSVPAAVWVTVALFVAGVIYALGRASARLDEHERRIGSLETVVMRVDENLSKILALFRSGGGK